jgi:aminoglycoside phosphotransferase (APT) family kinase protein
MPQWDADVDVGAELVRALLAEQFPALDASSARLLAEGWDNSVWSVEERLAFRFPRRAVAAPLVERELVVLPLLAPLLPVEVPAPMFVGAPGDRFPWTFVGSPLLPGLEPADATLTEADRVGLGAALGGFLRALHAPETLAAVDPDHALPVDPNRRADMSLRVERTREQLGALAAADLWHAPAPVERLLDLANGLRDPAGPLALCHGDLHLRHVLVDGGSLSGVIAGVIDWGDVCVADPAIDLVLYWSFLSPQGRTAFVVGYGEIGEERLLRARVLALFLCAILALYARDVGNASLEREALAGLDRTLSD